MKKFITVSVAASLAASMFVLTSAASADVVTAPVHVAGEKMDSGLGDLPHYSQWADPTGKNVQQARTAAAPADKSQGATFVRRDGKPAQVLAVQVSQAK